MKKAAYQKRFVLDKDITFKTTTRQKNVLMQVATKQKQNVSEYANKALTESLKEEDGEKPE